MAQPYSTNRGSHGPTSLSIVENAEYSSTSSSEATDSTAHHQRSDAPSPSSRGTSRNTAHGKEQPNVNGHGGERQRIFGGVQNEWRRSNPGAEGGQDRSSEYDAGDEQDDNGGGEEGEASVMSMDEQEGGRQRVAK